MRMVDHGGSCCGIRQIYGFDHSTVAELDEYIRELDNEHGQGNRLIEVVLSQRQVRGDRAPAGGWTAALAERGFRLVSRFNNSNSHNDCYIFHRVPAFKSIAPADLPFPWSHDAIPVAQQGIHEAGGPGVAGRAAAAPAWRAGDRFRYMAAGSSHHGYIGVIRSIEGANAVVIWETPDATFRTVSLRHCARMERQHTPPEVVAVATFYANHYVERGRGALYPTLAACRAAAPRCRRQDRLTIMSDGTQRWVDNVTE